MLIQEQRALNFKHMWNFIKNCLLLVFLGCSLRVIIGLSAYNSKIETMLKEEDEWYRNLAKCESIIIEKGDVACYDTFFCNIQKFGEGASLIQLRKQILPTIIMATRYGYSEACKNAVYENNDYNLNYYPPKKPVETQEQYELFAFDWAMFFLKRGIELKNDQCLKLYSAFLYSGFFSKEDSIYGKKISELMTETYDIHTNYRDSIELWKRYAELQKP